MAGRAGWALEHHGHDYSLTVDGPSASSHPAALSPLETSPQELMTMNFSLRTQAPNFLIAIERSLRGRSAFLAARGFAPTAVPLHSQADE